jgi:hypothetical protein
VSVEVNVAVVAQRDDQIIALHARGVERLAAHGQGHTGRLSEAERARLLAARRDARRPPLERPSHRNDAHGATRTVDRRTHPPPDPALQKAQYLRELVLMPIGPHWVLTP